MRSLSLASTTSRGIARKAPGGAVKVTRTYIKVVELGGSVENLSGIALYHEDVREGAARRVIKTRMCCGAAVYMKCKDFLASRGNSVDNARMGTK
jgi:hypothetical protein